MDDIIRYSNSNNTRLANVFRDNNGSRYYSVVMKDEQNNITKKTHCNFDTANNIAREFIERK